MANNWGRKRIRALRRMFREQPKPRKHLKIMSGNIGDGSWTKRVAILNWYRLRGVRMFVLQEGGDRVSDYTRLAARWGWHVWNAEAGIGVNNGQALPFLYHPDLPVIGRGGEVAVERGDWGPGAGGSPLTAKAITWLHLLYGLRVVNVHFAASATRPDKMYDRRRDHWRLYADRLMRRVSGWDKVVIVGDFNAEPTDYNLTSKVRADYNQYVRKATHGNRLIDWVLARGVVVASCKVGRKFSDHRVTITKIRYRW